MAFGEDLRLALMLALEDRWNRAGVDRLGSETRRLFPKGGASVELKL